MVAEAKKKKRKRAQSHRMVPIEKVHPNDWNPNELKGEMFVKLTRGIKRTLDEAGEIPPIVVRPSPKEKGQYEIVDGFHRWLVFKELKQPRIGVFVLKVGDKTARILTRTLNYLRGDPDRQRYAQGLVELVELGATEQELTDFLPESPEEIEQLWEEAEVTVEAVDALSDLHDEDDDAIGDGSGSEEVWVDLKFRVAFGQAEVIEREINRISLSLKGKHKRARALEYMAVQSGQMDLQEDLV